jgi:replicative DNA helicase
MVTQIAQTNNQNSYYPRPKLGIPDNFPYSQEAEEAVLGCIFMEPSLYADIALTVRENSFFLPRHQYIMGAMSRLSERNEDIDIITVSDELKVMGRYADAGGDAYLTHLLTSQGTTHHINTYARIVQTNDARRLVLRLVDEAKALALNPEIDATEIIANLSVAIDRTSSELTAHDMEPLYKHVGSVLNQIQTGMEASPAQLLSPTGLTELDVMLGGYRRKNVYIVAGRTHNGKSTLLYTSALADAKLGKRVAFYNTADGDIETVVLMFLAMETGISPSALLSGITPMQWRHVLKVAGDLADLPIFIKSDKRLTPKALYNHARAVKFKYGLDIIYVDYLQAMVGGPNMNDTERNNYISQAMGQIASKLNVAVVGAAQINRAGVNGNKAPEAHHIAGSTKYEMDSQAVIIVHKESLYNKDADPTKLTIMVAKNKVTGQTGTLYARLNPVTTALTDWSDIRRGDDG